MLAGFFAAPRRAGMISELFGQWMYPMTLAGLEEAIIREMAP